MPDETNSTRGQWREYMRRVAEFWERHPDESSRRGAYLQSEWASASRAGDEARAAFLIDISMSTEVLDGLDVLHEQLLDPGQRDHESIVREIQAIAYPPSVAVMRRAFEQGARSMAERNDSSIGEVAGWFSRAWLEIGTPEAIGCLRDFAAHSDAEIAAEMRARLGQSPG